VSGGQPSPPAEAVRDALTRTVLTLPAHLRRSLTWDQGKEMSQHRRFTIDTDVPVYFCDPHSPWQRGVQREHEWLASAVLPTCIGGSGGVVGLIARSVP